MSGIKLSVERLPSGMKNLLIRDNGDEFRVPLQASADALADEVKGDLDPLLTS